MATALRKKASETWDQVASLAFDALFLCLWGGIQYLADFALHFVRPNLQLMDEVLLWIIQIAFAVSTAFPILTHLIRDMVILFTRSKREIQAEERARLCSNSSCPLLTSGD